MVKSVLFNFGQYYNLSVLRNTNSSSVAKRIAIPFRSLFHLLLVVHPYINLFLYLSIRRYFSSTHILLNCSKFLLL